RPAAASAAVLASTIMCVRMAVLAGAVDAGILPRLFPILAVMAAAGGAAAWLVGRGQAGRTAVADGSLRNPFSLKAALTFAAVYTLVLLGVRAAQEHLGAGGLYLASALSAIVGGLRARGRLEADELAGAQDAERQRARERPAAEQAVEVVHAANGLPVRGDDDVARGHARLGRGAAALDPHHLDARILREPEPPRRAACERAVLASDAEVAAAHVAGGHELPEHPPGGVDRDAEAQALCAQDHGRVDADHPPAAVDQRPARVARVQRHVALDDALHQPPRGGAHGAPERAHHARRYGRAEAERVADRDHELADAELGRAAELGVRKPAPVDGDDREIGGGGGPDVRGAPGTSLTRRRRGRAAMRATVSTPCPPVNLSPRAERYRAPGWRRTRGRTRSFTLGASSRGRPRNRLATSDRRVPSTEVVESSSNTKRSSFRPSSKRHSTTSPATLMTMRRLPVR